MFTPITFYDTGCTFYHAGCIRDRHTILLGDAFKGRNDPAVGSTKRPFYVPSCSAALVL